MLTRAQFEGACRAFISKYATVESPSAIDSNGWLWDENSSSHGPGFMSRTTTQFWSSKPSAIDCLPIDSDLEEVFSQDDEESTTYTSNVRESLTSQQYVVYSPTFRVPTFYFAVHDSKGAPLSLLNLVRTSLFHSFAFERTEVISFGLTRPDSSFPLLSQGYHPILGTPCWYLHPCETGNSVDELMSELEGAEWSEEMRLVRWLEMWFLVVGTVVNSGLNYG